MYSSKNITAKMRQASASMFFIFFIVIVGTAEKSCSGGWQWNNARPNLPRPPNTGHPVQFNVR